MPFCGSSSCGCALVSVPATAGEISGALPTIDVAGNGTPTSPWNLTLNDQWAAEVATALVGTPWTTATPLLNSWTNLASPLQYRTRNGQLGVRGNIDPGTINATVFTLPVGFRPSQMTSWVVPAEGGGTGYVVAEVQTDGDIVVTNYYNSGFTPTAGVYIPETWMELA